MGKEKEKGMERKELNAVLAAINARCWDDEKFKAQFIAEPQKVFEKYEIPYNPNMEYRVLECSENENILVLPAEGWKDIISVAAKRAQDFSESAQIIPEGKRQVIVQNTDKVTYLVISNRKPVSAGADISNMPVDMLGGWFLTEANILAVANAFVLSNGAVVTEAVAGIDVAAVAVAVAGAAIV
jgi:hypothetical protein